MERRRGFGGCQGLKGRFGRRRGFRLLCAGRAVLFVHGSGGICRLRRSGGGRRRKGRAQIFSVVVEVEKGRGAFGGEAVFGKGFEGGLAVGFAEDLAKDVDIVAFGAGKGDGPSWLFGIAERDAMLRAFGDLGGFARQFFCKFRVFCKKGALAFFDGAGFGCRTG